jgi:hypothetical protein
MRISSKTYVPLEKLSNIAVINYVHMCVCVRACLTHSESNPITAHLL